jgi:hypothetical protein
MLYMGRRARLVNVNPFRIGLLLELNPGKRPRRIPGLTSFSPLGNQTGRVRSRDAVLRGIMRKRMAVCLWTIGYKVGPSYRVSAVGSRL